jgi:GT2 family glycosyltransferase
MSPNPPLVSILVVTWNRRRELVRCLQSAEAQTWPHKEIVVVDNASIDGTARMVSTHFPGVRLVRSDRNLGCPSGRNLGFAHCRGEYVYMLDDDGWLAPEAVERSVRRAETDPAIGVVMSRIHEVENDRVVRKRPPQHEEPVFLAGFSGGCSLIRRAVLERTGPFPEDFFRQAEENDLALRMLEHGYFCFLEPESVMFHAPSPSGRNNRAFMFYNLRNTNRTGLRLWPFPWCAMRPLVNFGHSLRFMVSLRDASLPWKVLGNLVADLATLSRHRHPVSVGTYRRFRQLEKCPSGVRPMEEAKGKKP